MLYILSVCKAEEGSGVVPPLTDDNAADGKISSAVTVVIGRMEYWFLPVLYGYNTPDGMGRCRICRNIHSVTTT